MTPTEQIHLETKTLEQQINDLITAFEKRTGVVVSRVQIANFLCGAARAHYQPLEVSVAVDLPPIPPESQSRPTGA